MTTTVTVLRSGQNTTVGSVSSRGEYQVSVSTGLPGVSVTAANVASGNLVLTLSNNSTIDAGSVAATVNTTVNTSAQYTWTNTHTFTANVTVSSIVANSSVGSNGQVLTSNGSTVYWANSSASANLSGYQTTAGLSANVATLTSNNTSYVGSVSAANVVSNSQLSSNLANYATTASLSSYQTTAGLSANVATLSSNNASYLGGVAANQYAYSNATVSGSRVTGGVLRVTTFSSATNAIHEIDLEGGGNTGVFYYDLSTNIPRGYGNGWLTFVTTDTVGSQTANNANYLGGVAAASYALDTDFGDLRISNTTITVANTTSNTSLSVQVYNNSPSASPPFSGVRTFIFGSDASIEFPDGTKQYTAYPGTATDANNASYLGGIAAADYAYANNVALDLGSSGYINFSASPAIGFAGITFNDGTFQNTAYTGTANNSNYLGGTAAASYLVTNTAISTGNVTVNGSITLTGNLTGNTAGFAIGYLDVPQNYTNTSFTIALSDRGKHIYTANGTSQTITIANNASVAFPVGTAISIVNQGAGTVTVARGTGVTMYLAANSTSADRSIATYGMATILKVGTDTWFINGAGVS